MKDQDGQFTRLGIKLAQQVSRLLPGTKEIDWEVTTAARWRVAFGAGYFEPIRQLDSIHLGDLLEVDRQKAALVANTRQFIAGYPANNALLWGARGTGKSSLIHALVNEYVDSGLRTIEVRKQDLAEVAHIATRLADHRFAYLIVCDDLSFDTADDGYKELKSALEGSMFTNSSNVLIYATSNRRHLLTEKASDNEATRIVDGELHQAEAVEEKISLSDRFGLWLSFQPFNQDQYLRVAQHWISQLAVEHKVALEWNDATRLDAIRWALNRGVRSGRTARHFAIHEVGQALVNRR